MLTIAESTLDSYEPSVVTIEGPDAESVMESYRAVRDVMVSGGYVEYAFSKRDPGTVVAVFLTKEKAAEAEADFLKSDRTSIEDIGQ